MSTSTPTSTVNQPQPEVGQLNISAAFSKAWGNFWVYSFLEDTWKTVLVNIHSQQDSNISLSLDIEPWLDTNGLDDKMREAELRILQGLPYTIQYTLHVNGQAITIEETGFLFSDTLSGKALIKGVIHNVTLQKSVVEDMERQRLFYEGTLNKMPVELVVLDRAQRYIFCNKTAIKSEELRSWLIGKTDLEYSLHRGKDPRTVEVRQTYFQQAVLLKTEVEWEEVQKNEDGTTDHSLKRYSPILDAEGEIVIVIGYGFNITDIRRAEIRAKESDELVRSLTESVQEGIFRLSSAGELLFANNAFYSLFDPELAFKLRTNEQDTDTRQIISYLASFEKPLMAQPAKWLEDMTSNWLISQRITDDNEFIDGVIVDVSALKHVQADLEQKNKELEKAYMELDKFVYSASHDLRAPLTSVLGLIKVMEGENAIGHNFGEALPYINMIKVSVERLDTFVREIIQYYRNNRTSVETISVNVAELVLEVYDLIRHLRPDLNIDLQIENQLNGPLLLDKPRLNIILNNLISNAVKYHSTDGGYVLTTAKIQDDNLVIQVTDNGPGIHPDHHDKLFDMFYRVGFDSSGSGLGLYIVYETVKKMDGNITLSSTLGVGTSFTVVLPLVA